MAKSKAFKNIMKGLNEVLDWTKDKGKLHVTLPGQKPRMMTHEEYKKATQDKDQSKGR